MTGTFAAQVDSGNRSVAIIGGGLAGLAAAAALCEQGLRVELFEARRKLGGRAGSYCDTVTGETVDHCQHVGMGCCTAFLDFCKRTGIANLFQRHKTLHFFGPDGGRYDLAATPLLPAPLHLGPALLRQGYLTWRERLAIARTLLQLRTAPPTDDPGLPTIGAWLRQHGQTEQAIRRFWSVVLVSALGESIDRASLPAARKVFVDGFMSTRDGYHVLVPTVPLGTLYDRVADWLTARGVRIHLGSDVDRIVDDKAHQCANGLQFADGSERSFEFVIAAVPWRRVRSLFPDSLAAAIPELRTIDQIESSPITSLHLWFDCPITSLPHAVLVDRVAQWLFARGEQPTVGDQSLVGHYYQVVISASRDLRSQPRETVRDAVLEELRALWPAARNAKLVHWRMITENDAVFSVRPGFDALRPTQQTPIPNVMLAGDWTCTGWPATMESAVRSGNLAAEAVVRACRNS